MITVKRLAPFGFTLFGLKIAATPHAQVMLIPIAQEWTRPNLTNTTTVRSVSAQSSVLPSYETQSIISISSATSAGSTPPSGVLSIGSPTLGASTVVTKASIPPLIIPMAGYHPWQAVPKQLNRRQNDPILTEAFLITPSPNASPVSITEMRQLVTSFTPVLTICPFVEPALSLEVSQMNTSLLASVNKATVEGPRGNGAYTNRKSVGVAFKKRSRDVSPYQLTTSCSVSYMSTTTQYCHTNLSPLGAPEISVTQCDQSVTFSSEFGYKVLPANAMTEPTFVNQKITLYSAWVLQTLTTYYVAAWSDINPGAVPAGPLGVVICSKDVCSTEWEVWETGTVPSQRMTSTFNIVATATGPANVMIDSLTTIDVPAFATSTISLSAVVTSTQNMATIIKSRFIPSAVAETAPVNTVIESRDTAMTTTILRTSTTTLVVTNSSESSRSVDNVTETA